MVIESGGAGAHPVVGSCISGCAMKTPCDGTVEGPLFHAKLNICARTMIGSRGCYVTGGTVDMELFVWGPKSEYRASDRRGLTMDVVI